MITIGQWWIAVLKLQSSFCKMTLLTCGQTNEISTYAKNPPKQNILKWFIFVFFLSASIYEIQSAGQGRLNSCPNSWNHLFEIHLLPCHGCSDSTVIRTKNWPKTSGVDCGPGNHFPSIIGHAACLTLSSRSPFSFRLYQKTADPISGSATIFKSKKAVPPPALTFDKYPSQVAIRRLWSGSLLSGIYRPNRHRKPMLTWTVQVVPDESGQQVPGGDVRAGHPNVA